MTNSFGALSRGCFAVRSAMPTYLESERRASHTDAATEVTDIEFLWVIQLAPGLCPQHEDGARVDVCLGAGAELQL